MKLEVKKLPAIVTITLDEAEAIALAQLAIQVTGQGPRQRFYVDFWEAVRTHLEAVGVEMPHAKPRFAIDEGRITTVENGSI